MDIIPLLYLAKTAEASDLHMVAYNPPILRIHGTLKPITDMPQLTPEDMEYALSQITAEEERAEFNENLELDFGYAIPYLSRFRVNVARQRGTISIAIRLLPLTIPTIDELELPQVCKDLIVKPRGFVVVSGPTGSGKSTTLAAMIDYLNITESRRVVTIEDPIEYIHYSQRCVVTQRELGSDTTSFAEALRHVLRQDPDVILVGEMRDLDTAAAALTIAETGHLVLTTGHAPSASQAIERIVDLFPIHERNLAQTRLASLLLGVFCQALVPRTNKAGRVAAIEIMLANPAVKNLIRENKIYQLPNVIRTNTQMGMELLDQCLVRQHRQGIISYDNVLAFCNDRDEVKKLIDSAESQPAAVAS
ncbi:MAG: PilT/PilU family type 4a pilus ATPase [Chloroflexi bacterium]|nr:PilT/PilU family type 4a pilus ATPase [Chloroflexota bacterium]